MSENGSAWMQRQEPAAGGQPEPSKILLVDDHLSNLVALESVLGTLGEELVKASSGEEALRQVLKNDFAVILMDVKMPGLDGFETAALIRSRERCRHTPIVFLTAHREDETELSRGYGSGAVDFLYKPINPVVLRSKVSVFIELNRKNALLRRQTGLLRARNEELERLVAEKERAEEEVRALNAELERRVARRTEELNHSNEELKQLAYATSHDLQEPLRTIASHTQLISRRLPPDCAERVSEYIPLITGAVERMSLVLRDLLDYSQASNLTPDVSRPIPLERVFQMAMSNLETSVRESGANVVCENLPEVHADFISITRVFQNLISNAIKYRRPEEPPNIVVCAAEHEDHWRFTVRDNGIGIDPQYHDRIFGVFKRLHGREYPGTGIGLSICKRIVERHGGAIWVESRPHCGSDFCFTLPKYPDAAAAA